jgi:hypothetical protein
LIEIFHNAPNIAVDRNGMRPMRTRLQMCVAANHDLRFPAAEILNYIERRAG